MSTATTRIVSVADNWGGYAVVNDAPELVFEAVVDHVLWEFVSDHETREIYRELIWRSFSGHAVKFYIRNDSPDQRRTAKLKIRRTLDGNVEFSIQTIGIVPLPLQELLRRRKRHAAGNVTECSFCNKIQTGPSEWLEVEDAVGKLRLFGQKLLPDLLQGVCPPCHRRLDAKLAERRQLVA